MAIFTAPLALAAEELIGEIIGAGAEDALGGPEVGPQAFMEDKDQRDIIMAAASTPGLALAMERVLEAVKSGRAGDKVVEQLAKNFGVADKADQLKKFSKIASKQRETAEALVNTAKTLPESSFFKQAKPVKEFVSSEADKALRGAKSASSRATNRFKQIAHELGREADSVTGAPVALIEDTSAEGIPDIPVDEPPDFPRRREGLPPRMEPPEVPPQAKNPEIPDVIQPSEPPEIPSAAKNPELPPVIEQAEKAGKEVSEEIIEEAAKDSDGIIKKAISKLPPSVKKHPFVALGALAAAGLIGRRMLSDEEPTKPVQVQPSGPTEEELAEEQARKIVNALSGSRGGQRRKRADDSTIKTLEKLRQDILKLAE